MTDRDQPVRGYVIRKNWKVEPVVFTRDFGGGYRYVVEDREYRIPVLLRDNDSVPYVVEGSA